MVGAEQGLQWEGGVGQGRAAVPGSAAEQPAAFCGLVQKPER